MQVTSPEGGAAKTEWPKNLPLFERAIVVELGYRKMQPVAIQVMQPGADIASRRTSVGF